MEMEEIEGETLEGDELDYIPIGIKDYKIEEKIDFRKPFKELLENNIKNFLNPKKEDFIDNQVLIDYIIEEKYKGKEFNMELPQSLILLKNFKGLKELLMYYKSEGNKIYIDNSIETDIYYQLQHYYFQKNSSEIKIRINLDIKDNNLKDQKKINKLIYRIIAKIHKITEIPINELYVTNIRKNNCLLFDIVRKKFNNKNDEDGKSFQELIEKNKENLKYFFKQIISEFENKIIYSIDIDEIIKVRKVINNYIFNPALLLEQKYNKKIGSFGLYKKYIFFGEDNVKEKKKNGKIYYYPNKRWEGFGLRISYHQVYDKVFWPDEIFSSESDWCICYSDLSFHQISYKIDNIKRDTYYILEKDKYSIYSLCFQCKINKKNIINERGPYIEMNDYNYIFPYRLLKENLDLEN